MDARQQVVQLLVLAFGDRPLEDSERAWLEDEVRAAWRARSADDAAVIVYEERLDEDVVATLERKRGPAAGNGWRGFYDLAAVDGTLPASEVRDAARFLADRSRRKVILPLFVEANAVPGAAFAGREAIAAGTREPMAIWWEGEAARHEPIARELRRALHERWGTARTPADSMPPRGSA